MIGDGTLERIAEYWPPFAVIFALLALQHSVRRGRVRRWPRLSSDMLDELQPFLDRSPATTTLQESDWQAAWRTTVTAVVAVLLGARPLFSTCA